MNTFFQYETMLRELFSHLAPEEMGEKWRLAFANSDLDTLIKSTADHFRTRPERPFCQTIDCSSCTQENALKALRGEITVVNITHLFPEGKIDWHFNPTLTAGPVNHEWLWQLNRMNFWRDLVTAYRETSDEKFAKSFNDQLFSWISTADLPPEEEWNAPGSLWRTIETGLRMMYAWPLAFETFRKSPAFTDENLCLMLSSMYRHALHLQQHHKTRNNWLLMEMSGLYTFGALFQEFRCAADFRRYAAEKFSEAVMFQILPDGMHDELSPDYHSVLLGCALTFCNIARLEHIPSELPEDFLKKLELSFESMLSMATPSLNSPRTNDCFTLSVSRRMRHAMELFPERKDFLWAATERAEGRPPDSEPSSSRFLPWAGFAVMRSDWSSDALYCCFDVGALGAGHRHQDKLNINIYQGAEELIFDDGGGQYENSIYRAYGVSAADHNTVLVDGLLQNRTSPFKVSAPIDAHWISNKTFDYACGTYDDEWGPLVLSESDAKIPLSRPARHRREVRFCKPDFFCIQDHLDALDGVPHTFEMRLHLDTLEIKESREYPQAFLAESKSKRKLLILPLLNDGLGSALLSGVDAAPMGGWFVGRNDLTRHQSTTLTMTVSKVTNCRFATLLIPLAQGEKLPEIKKRSTNLFVLRLRNKEYLIDLEDLSK